VSAGELRTIAISDFRSIRGKVAIALNAPVVLLHGINGAGKSTIMSALELALTGSVSGVNAPDREHLVHRGANNASIELATSHRTVALTIEGLHIRGTPLLEADDARFFGQRCYLQQRTLGRLLELYENPSDDGESPLTMFVKDLLGLDELDALIDGLYPVTDKRRVKRLVPEYAELDRELDRRREEIRALQHGLKEVATQATGTRARLGELLAGLEAPAALEGDLESAAQWLELGAGVEERALVDLVGARRELTAMTHGVERLAGQPESERAAALEADAATARATADAWRSSHGAALEAVLDELRKILPGLPAAAGTADPAVVRAAALEQLNAELDRVTGALTADERARSEAERLDEAIAAGQRRLAGLDEQLASGTATAAEELGKALAALIPHVHTEQCPVCERDYSEVSREPLSSHLAARVSALGAQAERYQQLAEARLEALSDLRRVSDDRGALTRRRMEPDTKVETQAIAGRLDDARRRLVEMAAGVAEGAALIRHETEAERDLMIARDRDRVSVELRASVERLAASLGRRAADPTAPLADIVTALADYAAARIALLEENSARRAAAAQAVEQLAAALKTRHQSERQIADELEAVERDAAAITELERRRSIMRTVRDEAEAARVRIVRRVFTHSLNRVWRDLFVRLAPEEPFVPAFRVPGPNQQRVVATLETMHRDGKPGGPPAAMLSAGNLNTAALTLFLALNLSVAPQLPWILLDDPVQSMDEVHVAQFAALLRTLSKEHQRRVVIAVHERALFEYLALELSPANPDDGLVTVELSRVPDGSTLVESNFQPYVEDRAFDPA
jgi:exonuclease SbcC